MRVLYVADNRCRPNFGCRATSMALADIIKRQHQISSTIYGDVTTWFGAKMYTPNLSVKQRIRTLLSELHKKVNGIKDTDFLLDNVEQSVNNFLAVYDKNQILKEIYDAVISCDAVMLNGEGSFMFREKPIREYWFYLFILALAQRFKKKTYLLNAMFSDGTNTPHNEHAIQECRQVLNKCTLVTIRDMLSLRYYSKHIGGNAIYMPDALFSWTKYAHYLPLAISFPNAGIIFPDEEWQWHEFDFSKPYVVLSAGSRTVYNWEELSAIQQYIKLVNALKEKYQVVIQLTCKNEGFLREVAKQTQTKIIDNKTNILFGMSVLANAACYVSGRWHPSILASLGGTPCVMLQSNSHKSSAIYSELEYNQKAIIYNNPPADNEIELIVENVDLSIKTISRDKILQMVRAKSDMLHHYEQLLK